MRTVLKLALVTVLTVVCTGCWTMPNRALWAPVVIAGKRPGAVGDATVGDGQVGRAKAQGIILVGFGDASISTAMKNGGITKIHHVASEELCVLGIYSRKEIIVYGEYPRKLIVYLALSGLNVYQHPVSQGVDLGYHTLPRLPASGGLGLHERRSLRPARRLPVRGGGVAPARGRQAMPEAGAANPWHPALACSPVRGEIEQPTATPWV